jgi:hypothetical protein
MILLYFSCAGTMIPRNNDAFGEHQSFICNVNATAAVCVLYPQGAAGD